MKRTKKIVSMLVLAAATSTTLAKPWSVKGSYALSSPIPVMENVLGQVIVNINETSGNIETTLMLGVHGATCQQARAMIGNPYVDYAVNGKITHYHLDECTKTPSAAMLQLNPITPADAYYMAIDLIKSNDKDTFIIGTMVFSTKNAAYSISKALGYFDQ